MKKVISIEGMSCGHCSGRVTKLLSGMKGISEVKVSLEEKKAFVDCSDDISSENIKQEIEDLGFNVTGIELA